MSRAIRLIEGAMARVHRGAGRSACSRPAPPPRANRRTPVRRALPCPPGQRWGSGLAFSSAALCSPGTAMFSVATSGALTPVVGTAPDPSATSVVFNPSGTLLAAGNAGSDTVSMFSVGSSGALTSVPGSSVHRQSSGGVGPVQPERETARGERRRICVHLLSGCLRNLTPAAGSPHSVKGVGRVAFSPAGGLLAVPDSAGVGMYSVSSSGALTAVVGSPFTASGWPGGDAAFAPAGNLLTVSNLSCAGCQVSTGVTTYSVAVSGALTPTGSATFWRFAGVCVQPERRHDRLDPIRRGGFASAVRWPGRCARRSPGTRDPRTSAEHCLQRGR